MMIMAQITDVSVDVSEIFHDQNLLLHSFSGRKHLARRCRDLKRSV